MRTLCLGCSDGDDVQNWQNFLVGQGSYWLEVDGKFSNDTVEGTKDFQKSHGLTEDGEVGPTTLKIAIQEGFPDPDAVVHSADDESGPNWPPKPDFPPMSFMDRAKIFGTFSYMASGTSSNPEAIKITDGWDVKNIVTVDIPQLRGVKGCLNGEVSFHTKGASQLRALWAAWEAAGLLPLILTFDGGWAARFVRGSKTYLSNHSYGTAMDVNYQWNQLGVVGALKGQPGSVRELISIAIEHGFYWGGWFNRRDPMHFEIAKILSPEIV